LPFHWKPCAFGAYIHFFNLASMVVACVAMAQIVDWSMLVAFVLHVPPAMIAPGDGVAFWSVLFLGGYCEWFLLIAAIAWGYREARSVSTLRRQHPQSPW
jgi:hypothetical protein